MKNLILSALILLFTGLSSSLAQADDSNRLTVVELFTSQGCSSCPPADAALKSLRNRPGTLTLSWPVDYWDRLGWEDTFAHPHNAIRQAAYNKRLGRGGVFTPQMILDGRVQCVGSKPEKVRASIAKVRSMNHPWVRPSLTSMADNTVRVTLPATDVEGPVSIRVVWYLGDAEVEIGDGENQGRRLYYTNVVRASDVVDMEWQGKAETLTLDLGAGRAAGADHVAILLQQDYVHGPIIGAASLTLPEASTQASAKR
ncbi:DUF1223 domain-containing protein [Kordiimonas sp.]|uniref:DUF1223 domain-containing protein n=1 Tax=Kordiimonas sp. TaxID=1970157 RepID=UPI003A8DBE04